VLSKWKPYAILSWLVEVPLPCLSVVFGEVGVSFSILFGRRSSSSPFPSFSLKPFPSGETFFAGALPISPPTPCQGEFDAAQRVKQPSQCKYMGVSLTYYMCSDCVFKGVQGCQVQVFFVVVVPISRCILKRGRSECGEREGERELLERLSARRGERRGRRFSPKIFEKEMDFNQRRGFALAKDNFIHTFFAFHFKD